MSLTLFSFAAELAQKARREIADYLANGKDERARIRVLSYYIYTTDCMSI